jgi:hypothetical protein
MLVLRTGVDMRQPSTPHHRQQPPGRAGQTEKKTTGLLERPRAMIRSKESVVGAWYLIPKAISTDDANDGYVDGHVNGPPNRRKVGN